LLVASTLAGNRFEVETLQSSLAQVDHRVTVYSHGLTSVDRRIQLLVLSMSPLAILSFVFLTNGGHGAELVPKIIAALATLALYDLSLTEILSVRRIDIDPEGVTFHYLLHKERGRWGDLSPHRNTSPRGSYFGRGSWSLSRRNGEGRLRGNKLTREQALAVIHYPGRPSWDFSGAPWEELVVKRDDGAN
jgi:hypothetical protein